MYLAGLAAGPIGVFFGVIGYIEAANADVNAKDLGAKCTKIDDENVHCTKDVNIPMVLIPPFTSRLDLETVRGIPEGLVLGGKIVNLGNTPVGNSEVTVRPFAWTLVGGCRPIGSPGFRIVNQAEINVAAVYQKGFPVTDASFCKAYVIKDSDPVGEFKLVTTPQTITVIPQFEPQYLASPYPVGSAW